MPLTRRNLMALSGALPWANGAAAGTPFQVGAYYFGNYHVDPRNEKVHGPGWTEWELVRRAEPKFAGHRQPKKPLWGYADESDPAVFARKIDAAADHALTHFIFDWYWYDDGPFLNRALESGYLKAANNSRLKFCLMWANHDWVDIQPAKRGEKPPLQYPGAVSRATFERMSCPTFSGTPATGRSTASRISRSTSSTGWWKGWAEWRRRGTLWRASNARRWQPDSPGCT